MTKDSQMNDMVERVARAIDVARGPNDSVYDYAQAAIAAMQQPTPRMLQVGAIAYNREMDSQPIDQRNQPAALEAAFRAMLAAAQGASHD